MERVPLQDDYGARGEYGTAESARVQVKRKGGLSAKCIIASSAIAVVILVGMLHFWREEPASSVSSKPSPATHAAPASAHQAPKPIVVAKKGKAVSSSLHLPARSVATPKSTSSLTAHELAQLPSDVRVALNTSVDPCDNFYEFACGGWESVTSIPNWQSSWAKQWDGVTTDVEKKTVKALEKDDGPAGKFYKSCMDTATIQKVGTRPLKPWLAAVERVKDHASLVQALANFALADMTAFFGWFVDADSEDSSLNSFFVAQVQQRWLPHYC